MRNVKAYYESTRDVDHTVNCKYRTITERSVGPHFHQSIEITYILSGALDFHIGAQCFRAEKGQITFVPSGYVHFCGNGTAETVVLIIPKKYYEKYDEVLHGYGYFFLGNAQVNARIGALMCELADGREGMNELLLYAYTDMVLGLIVQNYEPARLASAHDDLMLKIIEYIDKNYRDAITLDSISAHFGYSKYYFSRLFNRIFGCTLNGYINSVRARAIQPNAAGKKTAAILDAGFGSLSGYYRMKNAGPKEE